MSRDWIVAQTAPSQERRAEIHIARKGVPCYCPRFVERTARSERRRVLFPSYVFVKAPRHAWQFLLTTQGVVGVIMSCDAPARSPQLDAAIAELISRTDPDGLVNLPSPPPAPRQRYRRGQRVRAVSGVFRGLQGVYQGLGPHGRISVLLDILGRKTRVAFTEDDLAAA